MQVGRGGWDIYQNGLNWENGLQVAGGLLGLGGNYTTWRRLPPGVAPRTSGIFASDVDPLRERIGPAYRSHPDEYDNILRQLREAGVDIDFRPGNLAYSPDRGGVGRIILDPEASMRAVRHEFRHFLDNQQAGFPSFAYYYNNGREFARLEARGYL
ncbi:MAG: hypothetical protein RMI91_15295, partial [Gemmatales bacterium]|nr:hypothetical protein [Gemmatales bacterium]